MAPGHGLGAALLTRNPGRVGPSPLCSVRPLSLPRGTQPPAVGSPALRAQERPAGPLRSTRVTAEVTARGQAHWAPVFPRHSGVPPGPRMLLLRSLLSGTSFLPPTRKSRLFFEATENSLSFLPWGEVVSSCTVSPQHLTSDPVLPPLSHAVLFLRSGFPFAPAEVPEVRGLPSAAQGPSTPGTGPGS